MKRPLQSILVLFFVSLPVCRGGAQTVISSQSRTAGNGSSLAATMQLIQVNLGRRGTVSYAATIHDHAAGSSWTNQFSTLDTDFVANPTACRISFHQKRTRDGAETFNGEYSINLRNLQKVVTEPLDQVLKQRNIAAGHRNWDASSDSPVTALVAIQSTNWEWYFYFTDQGTAARVATAMNHAVALCGGGREGQF